MGTGPLHSHRLTYRHYHHTWEINFGLEDWGWSWRQLARCFCGLAWFGKGGKGEARGERRNDAPLLFSDHRFSKIYETTNDVAYVSFTRSMAHTRPQNFKTDGLSTSLLRGRSFKLAFQPRSKEWSPLPSLQQPRARLPKYKRRTLWREGQSC